MLKSDVCCAAVDRMTDVRPNRNAFLKMEELEESLDAWLEAGDYDSYGFGMVRLEKWKAWAGEEYEAWKQQEGGGRITLPQSTEIQLRELQVRLEELEQDNSMLRAALEEREDENTALREELVEKEEEIENLLMAPHAPHGELLYPQHAEAAQRRRDGRATAEAKEALENTALDTRRRCQGVTRNGPNKGQQCCNLSAVEGGYCCAHRRHLGGTVL